MSVFVQHTAKLVSCASFVADRIGVDFSCIGVWPYYPDLDKYSRGEESAGVIQEALKAYCDSLHPLLFSGAVIEYQRRGYHTKTAKELADEAEKALDAELEYQDALNTCDDLYAKGLI